MQENSSEDLPDSKNIEQTFNTTEQHVQQLHNLYIEGAQYTGYILESINGQRKIYSELHQRAKDDSDFIPVITSGIDQVDAIDNEVRNLYEQVRPTLPGLYNLSTSVYTFISTSGSSAALADLKDYPWMQERPPFLQIDEEDIVQKFEDLDPALGSLYREIWQAYYGTNADNYRAAIGLMRQAFDHFFDILAPDESVRASPFWKPKKGERPDQVIREERIKYSIHTHVSDKARAKTLASSLDQILETYQVLNRFHERGILKQEPVRLALFSMKRFLEDFANSLDV